VVAVSGLRGGRRARPGRTARTPRGAGSGMGEQSDYAGGRKERREEERGPGGPHLAVRGRGGEGTLGAAGWALVGR
jgi:hypothetical protein